MKVCSQCGCVEEDSVACQQKFEAIIEKEFSNYLYAKVHRLTVDVYALQHPEKYMASPKSFAAHLTGIYAALFGEDPRAINRSVQKWLSRPVDISCPEPPQAGQRGELTISHLHDAADWEEHEFRVREWAVSTWDAWQGYEEFAMNWIKLASR